jgi:PAS domain-containing protein
MGWLLGLTGSSVAKETGDGAAAVLKAGGMAKSNTGSTGLRDRRWCLAAIGVALLHLTHPLTWGFDFPGAWFPPAGIGFLLVAWLGPWAALLVMADALLVVLQAWAFGSTFPWVSGNGLAWTGAVWDSLLSGAEVWVAWWSYQRLARGARQLLDPGSASLFLLLVPGFAMGVCAFARALALPQASMEQVWSWALACWLSRSLAILALVPPLLVTLTPWLVRHGLAEAERPDLQQSRGSLPYQGFGDALEIAGLALGTGTLGIVLVAAQGEQAGVGWQLWVLPLLLVVWASLRQGLRGGTIVAAVAVVFCTSVVPALDNVKLLSLPLQGYLLAQCSTALLVGVSFSWIYISESRYRQVVEHIPVVLYSARLLEHGSALRPGNVEITFVSPACKDVYDCAPEEMLGDYERWLRRIHPEDHELVLAALAQLSRYMQPVTFEYRLQDAKEGTDQAIEPSAAPELHDHMTDFSRASASRWVRDTLVPLLTSEGQLLGWEGVVVDITEQRFVADDLRRTTNMFHALVTHLPAGVFFVHAPSGRPILVNARARQLLGQREHVAADLSEWPEVYRLRRPDGTPYPAEDLPVCRAMQGGVTSMRDDIVVHRPDGRRVPLTTWAAPIDLNGKSCIDAAVWVLEDLTDLRQTELIRRESSVVIRKARVPTAGQQSIEDSPDNSSP